MKIRIRNFIFWISVGVFVGYLFGTIWPLKMFQFEVSDTPITKGDHRANLINLFVAVGTILTVIVALFKEDIVGLVKKVDLKVDLLSNTIKDDYDKENNVTKRYYNNIVIQNVGNVNALQCEINIKSIKFLKTGDPQWQEINIESPQLNFLYNPDVSYIPIGATKEIQICEISSTTKPVKGNKEDISFKLGNNIILEKSYGGEWEILGEISMSNAPVKKFKINIKWNGEWNDNHERMQIASSINK